MAKYYRIVFEEYDAPPEPITQETVLALRLYPWVSTFIERQQI